MRSITGKNTAYFGDVNRVDFGLAEIMQRGANTGLRELLRSSEQAQEPQLQLHS